MFSQSNGELGGSNIDLGLKIRVSPLEKKRPADGGEKKV